MAEAQLRELQIPNCKHLFDKPTAKQSLAGQQPEFLLGNPLIGLEQWKSNMQSTTQSTEFTL